MTNSERTGGLVDSVVAEVKLMTLCSILLSVGHVFFAFEVLMHLVSSYINSALKLLNCLYLAKENITDED